MFCAVQINYELTIPSPRYLELCRDALAAVRASDGLLWKLWILSQDQRRAGGLYLFRDRASAEAYVGGPLIDGLRRSPALRDFECRVTPVLVELSELTGLPTLRGAA